MLDADRRWSYPGMREDKRVHRYVSPVSIVQAVLTENPEVVLNGSIQPGYLTTLPAATIRPGGSILVDFGVELHGFCLVTFGEVDAASQLVITFGESVSECLGTPTTDHAVHQQTVKHPTLSQVYVGETAFRFLHVRLKEDAVKPCPVFAIAAEAVYYDWPWMGAFHSSDPLLDQIWETGVYTCLLNCQHYIYDGAKRDRMVWMGDLCPEVRTLLSVFQDASIIERSLDFLTATLPQGAWYNGISSYTCWWVIVQYELFMARGNFCYLERQREQLLAVTKQLLGCLGKDGLEHFPGWRFLEWSTNDDDAVKHAGLQGLLAWSLDDAARMLTVLGETQAAAQAAQGCALLRTHAPDCRQSKIAAAVQVLGGVADAVKLNREVFSAAPCDGVSTFYSGFILEARARAMDVQGGLELLRTYFGAMLKLGATTFWEDFDMAWLRDPVTGIDELPVPGKKDIHADFGKYCYKGWRHSLCHGWSSGPVSFLTNEVLGVKPVKPGYTEFVCRPALGDLELAEGAVATPFGPIEVKHHKINGRVKTEVNAPATCRQI